MHHLSRSELKAVAHAFGLGHEFFPSTHKLPDPFGPVVQDPTVLTGYLTQIEWDKVRQSGSEIAINDDRRGGIVYQEWQQLVISEAEEELELQKPLFLHKPRRSFSIFTVDEATFAATETYNHVPERVFLYVTQPKFDLEYIIKLLRNHRQKYPAPTYGFNRAGFR